MSSRLAAYVLIYKLSVLLVGLISIILGYFLFVKGIFGPLASLEASKGQTAMTLENAAPGLFFALFGSSVVGFAVFKGLRLESHDDEPSRNRDHEHAVLEWQNVLNSVRSLQAQGKLTPDDLQLFHLNMASLASALKGTDADTKGPLTREEFRGFASAPRS